MQITQSTKRQAIDYLSDQKNRLNSLYFIVDESAKRVQFKMNDAQDRFYDAQHDLDLLLKARQLGFTTIIQLIMLDDCIFTPDLSAGVIAHNREDAEDFFRKKIKYAYDNLPEGLRQAVSAEQDSARSLAFSNGSSIRVGTSLRSGTYQRLHISEYGKLCAKFPEKANEVKTGALNTVHAGQKIWIESTAEGQDGDFYEKSILAQQLQRSKAELTPLDFKFHFFPWWRHPEYRLDADVVIDSEAAAYFDKLASQGIILSREQKAWYVKKSAQQGEDMRREYPSTPEEAFEAAVEGAYYAKQFEAIDRQNRVTRVAHAPELGVETWWDIGRGDANAIWFAQRYGLEVRLIDFYENAGEGLPHYVQELRKRADKLGYNYTRHVAPHDIRVKEYSTNRKRIDTAAELGIHFEVCPDHRVEDGIEATRSFLAKCWFDEERCADGVKRLRNYRKEWDENKATWKNVPRHDWACHGADAFRYGVMSGESAEWSDKPLIPQIGSIA